MKSFTEAMLLECKSMGIQAIKLPERISKNGFRLERLSDGKKVFVYGTKSSLDSKRGIAICRDKLLTEFFLKSLKIMTTNSLVLTSAEDAKRCLVPDQKMVIKPALGCCGKGVTLGIQAPDQAAAAYRHATQSAPGKVLAQPQLGGNCYRVQVLKGKIAFVVQKIQDSCDAPASIAAGAKRVEIDKPISTKIKNNCLLIAEKTQMHCLGIDVMSTDICSSEGVVIDVNENPILYPCRAKMFLESFFEA